MLKLLIDECLSPRLVALAWSWRLHLSTHATWIGLKSRQDWAVVRRAVDEGYAIVTNDKKDYIPLIGREEIHSGLICLNARAGLMDFLVQKKLLERAMLEMGGSEPVNEVLDLTMGADGKIAVVRYNFSRGNGRTPDIFKL